jgi:predicted class III extradiol MEMO1 family dioxygenase
MISIVNLLCVCCPALPCMQRDPAAFTEYLHTYHNTICGRHPISVLLQVRTAGLEDHV